jgi:glycosyltransferase involved in cell wall biosynthesis
VLREAARVADKLVVNLAALGRREEDIGSSGSSASGTRAVRRVSVVIPCHNGLAYNGRVPQHPEERPCRRGSAVEIVVVDDASSDGTADLLARLRKQDDRYQGRTGIGRNGGLPCRVQYGCEGGRGDYLLLPEQRYGPAAGLARPLLAIFDDHPDAGVAGGKLLFEDGRLQEAGALVFSDASAAKIGYFDPDVESPLYQYVREVDYVSAAFMLTPS